MKLYRINEVFSEAHKHLVVKLELLTFEVYKETKCGGLD